LNAKGRRVATLAQKVGAASISTSDYEEPASSSDFSCSLGRTDCVIFSGESGLTRRLDPGHEAALRAASSGVRLIDKIERDYKNNSLDRLIKTAHIGCSKSVVALPE
jgi:hypothetical protein